MTKLRSAAFLAAAIVAATCLSHSVSGQVKLVVEQVANDDMVLPDGSVPDLPVATPSAATAGVSLPEAKWDAGPHAGHAAFPAPGQVLFEPGPNPGADANLCRSSVIGAGQWTVSGQGAAGAPEEPDRIEVDTVVRTAVFDSPCRFEYCIHNADGSSTVVDQLIIYEGMSVCCFADGRYKVSLAAETPQMPVVVRLQLSFSPAESIDFARGGTITLPPLTLNSEDYSERHQPSRTVRATQRGYSFRLKQLLTTSSTVFPGRQLEISLSRDGIARFGSVPERAEYSVLPLENSEPAAR